MSSIENAPANNLSAGERAMYEKFAANNPGITVDDFIELRTLARAGKSDGVKNFFAVNGVIMEEKDIPSAEEIKDQFE